MDEHEETQEMSQEVLDQVRKCTTEEDIEDLMREIEDASPPDDTSNSKRQEKNN